MAVSESVRSRPGRPGVLILGHGSKVGEANDTLRRVARAVEERIGGGPVMPAFLQMEKPDFQQAVDALVGGGFTDITVMPYFLYSGAHVTVDLPGEIESARSRHPGLEVKVVPSLGYHGALVDIVLERIGERPGGRAPGAGGPAVGADDRHPIEAESFRIIGSRLGATRFSGAELEVLKRVIHTTADFEYNDILRLSPGAVEAGVRAIRSGAPVITDVRMVESGISKERLAQFGSSVLCFSSDADVAEDAASTGSTRTAAAMRKAAGRLDGAVVAIGNAPTALEELLRLLNEGAPRPALIVGVPVGFVGAAEAKERLMGAGVEYIATAGIKGGSTVAVAIVNALAIEALKRPAGRT